MKVLQTTGLADPALLQQVVKPARYTGQEWNSIVKELKSVAVSMALAMPDVYEVGMSNLGLKILYEILNNRQQVAVERVYAPWVDMEEKMRAADLKLCTLESQSPLTAFDIVGFSLQYELSYSNVLNMLDLAGIPLLAAERKADWPLIICGGPCTFNAEPMADFIDAFILGEGEEVMVELTDIVAAWKLNGCSGGKTALLQQLATLVGVYIPSLYEVSYQADGCIAEVRTLSQTAALPVVKRLVKDLDAMPAAVKPIVPYLDIVHNRIMLEVFRGCTRGCRFCQAGIIYRPVRERKQETLLAQAQKLVNTTGYDEISLVSLSTADYSCLPTLIGELLQDLGKQGVSMSLPSLRVDSFSIELAQQVQQVRKSSLTFAPEAGTQRLRDVINKGVTEENLISAATAAFRAGWSAIKLYFMIGLPTETEEDIAGIADLAAKTVNAYRAVYGRRGAKITVSVSSFVPKPHTPFQWCRQNTAAELAEKQRYLRSLLKDKSITLHWHDAATSFLEGVFARGDRRLGAVILEAWRRGAKFDGWSEHFHARIWEEAFAATGIDPAFYANRQRETEEILPWDHLHSGVEKTYLQREYEQALAENLTGDCRRGECSGCGVCSNLDVAVADWGQKQK